MQEMKPLLAKVADGKKLNRDEARLAFTMMMSGNATPSQIAGLLMAIRVRGETIDEITAAVEVMRERMIGVSAPPEVIDIVGTGGDASGSYNISTAATFVAAGAGLKIAKHGNRALSSRSGSSDVLVALGIKIDLMPEQISTCINEAGIGFMFAPSHHASMKYVGPTRVELGTRTIFNLLGPLSNPAGAKRQVTGVFSRDWVMPLAEVLKNLGSEACWICHGSGGFDEIVPTGPSWISQLADGEITNFEVTPQQVGLTLCKREDLIGGEAAHNAQALEAVLSGHKSAFRDAVVMTAGAAILVAGETKDYAKAVRRAEQSIDSGHAALVLAQLREVSNRL